MGMDGHSRTVRSGTQQQVGAGGRRRRLWALAGVGCLGLLGCGESAGVVSLSGSDALSSNASGLTLASRPVLHPTSVRYSDPGASNVGGRSGSAELSVRALLGRSGETVLEVTTGELDSLQRAPGALSRIQLKRFDSSGALEGTQNFAGSTSGRFRLVTRELARGQAYQVQANVRGIDGARTDVVTADGVVRRRPNLAVQEVQAPEKVQRGATINVLALVVERNGEVGATADCVLRLDGAEADRVESVWVAAGDQVSCAFSVRLEQAGEHALEVRLEGTTPADDDDTDDAASSTVRVEESIPFQFSANVQAYDYGSEIHSETLTLSTSGTWVRGSETVRDSVTTGWSGYASVRGTLARAFPFPMSSVSLGQTVEGSSVHSWRIEGVTPTSVYDSPGASQSCAWLTDGRGAYLYLCSRTANGAGETSVEYARYGGQVTYFSSVHLRQWSYDSATGAGSSSAWVQNATSGSSSGAARWPSGAVHGFQVAIESGGAVHRFAPSVTLTPFGYDQRSPRSCTLQGSAAQSTQTCYAQRSWQSGARGSLVGTSP